MILVDTSVLIDWLKNIDNAKTQAFAVIVKTPSWGLSVLTYQELLQGVKHESEYDSLKSYLITQNIVYLPNTLDFYNAASGLYRTLRRNGETIRSIADTLIASTAIHNGYQLLHNDKDFDVIAKYEPKLKICQP